MAYSHVAHDCFLNNHIIIGNASQIAGEVKIDDFAIVSGGTLVHQFSRISKHVMIQGGSRVGRRYSSIYTDWTRSDNLLRNQYCRLTETWIHKSTSISNPRHLSQCLYTRGLNNTEALKAIETELRT